MQVARSAVTRQIAALEKHLAGQGHTTRRLRIDVAAHSRLLDGVLAEFAQHAPPGSRMVLDVMTRQAVGCAARHASVGPTGAEFRWGVGRMAELAAVHPRLHKAAQNVGVNDSVALASRPNQGMTPARKYVSALITV